MSKIALRLRFNDYWRIGIHESWFTDMSREGLHLKKMGWLLAHFEKGEPEEKKYRIDIAAGMPAVDQLSLYQECGWDYVTSYGKFRVFSSPEERNAPELHTEPGEQSYTLGTFDRELKLSALIVTISAVFIFLIFASIFLMNGTPILNMVKDDFFQQVLVLIVEIFVLVVSLQAWLSIHFLRRRMLEGKPIDHHADWRKARCRSNVVRLVLLLFSIAVILLPILSIIKNETAPLTENLNGLPIVRLADMEENPGLKPGMEGRREQAADLNRCIKKWSPLAPVQLETEEYGFVPGVHWSDDSGTYSPSIHMQYYELLIPALADSLIHDLILSELYDEAEQHRLMKVDTSSFDTLYILEEEAGAARIFAASGNKVFYIRYYGYAGSDKLLSLAEGL